MPVWARIVLSVVLFLLASAPLSVLFFVVSGISEVVPKAYVDEFGILCSSLSMFSGAIAATFILRKYADKKSYYSLGFSVKGFTNSLLLAVGVIVGVMFGGTLFLERVGFISISYRGFDFVSVILYGLTFTCVAFTEEILFRGYILNNLLQKQSKFWALTTSSLIFGLMHSINPNVQVLPIFNIILAGCLLGVAYIYTQNLWYPIILHFLWNFIQGPVLGYPVSGIGTSSIYQVNLTGAGWVNGGKFGFEGSVVCTALCLIAMLLIAGYYSGKLKSKDVIKTSIQ